MYKTTNWLQVLDDLERLCNGLTASQIDKVNDVMSMVRSRYNQEADD